MAPPTEDFNCVSSRKFHIVLEFSCTDAYKLHFPDIGCDTTSQSDGLRDHLALAYSTYSFGVGRKYHYVFERPIQPALWYQTCRVHRQKLIIESLHQMVHKVVCWLQTAHLWAQYAVDRITVSSAVQKIFGYVLRYIKWEDSANILRYNAGTFCRAYHKRKDCRTHQGVN